MLNNKKIVVVMPAYNAEKTLAQTYGEIPHDIVDDVILVDDASADGTVPEAQQLGIKHVVKHPKNRGYGGNQKSCYAKALSLGADVVIMVHPDYQYTPKLITAMTSLIAEGLFDCVLGSRVLGRGALQGGMPLYKYVSNRLLSFLQNIVTGHKLSEYHTGYRAYSRDLLLSINLDNNSDDFIFDNQLLLQIISYGKRIGEISCPTSYIVDSSSISGVPLLRYGFSVLIESVLFTFARLGIPSKRYKF